MLSLTPPAQSKEGEKKSLVRDLCKSLRASFTAQEWQTFDQQTTDKDRIQLFLDRPEILATVQSQWDRKIGEKNKDKALDLKQLGNRTFGSGDNEKALDLYSQCLRWLPHDDENSKGTILCI